jgi:hypothetical protein
MMDQLPDNLCKVDIRKHMKKSTLFLILLLSLSYLPGCSPKVYHADQFYNYNDNDFPRDYLPIINPVEATRASPNSSWNLDLLNSLHVDLPKRQEQEVRKIYIYSHVVELEKFGVKEGVIMAYSGYVNHRADAFIQENYYHWFVMIPSENITKGFHTEAEFNEYIETIGIQNPVWQTPDEAFEQFRHTGCLEWIPDCQ